MAFRTPVREAEAEVRPLRHQQQVERAVTTEAEAVVLQVLAQTTVLVELANQALSSLPTRPARLAQQ